MPPEGHSDPSPELCLFHLVWAPIGLRPFEAFLDAYRAHPAGVPHRLRFLFNGFGSESEAAPYLDRLDGIEAEAQFVSPPTQDIPAYFEGARAVDTEFVGFLNSHAMPLGPGWLAKLQAQAIRPGVGLVGASGSSESFLTAVEGVPFEGPRFWGRNPIGHYRSLRSWLDRWSERRQRVAWARSTFDPFPNPHLRTSVFLLRRELMLGLEIGPMATKEQAWAFESGKQGLTAQVLARGLAVLVVGRDGEGYPIAEAARSGTFRSGDQWNLLISDNRTRDYDQASPAERRTLASLAWGEGMLGPAREAEAVAR